MKKLVVGLLLSVLGVVGCSQVISTAPAKPLSVIGLYNCHGWVGISVVMSDGKFVGPLTMRPSEAIALVKKAGIPASNQIHMFPAQGECAKQAPYEQQAPQGGDDQGIPPVSELHPYNSRRHDGFPLPEMLGGIHQKTAKL